MQQEDKTSTLENQPSFNIEKSIQQTSDENISLPLKDHDMNLENNSFGRTDLMIEEIKEKVVNNKATPFSMCIKEKVGEAQNVARNIQESIDVFQIRLQEAKMQFLSQSPSTLNLKINQKASTPLKYHAPSTFSECKLISKTIQKSKLKKVYRQIFKQGSLSPWKQDVFFEQKEEVSQELTNILQKNFQFKNFFSNQEEIFQILSQGHSVLFSAVPGSGKTSIAIFYSLKQQSDRPVVIINPSYSKIIKDIKNLPRACACTSFTASLNKQTKEKNIDLVKQQKSKIIFIHLDYLIANPELLNELNVNPSLVTYEDANIYTGVSDSFRLSCYSMLQKIQAKFNDCQKLILGRFLTQRMIYDLTNIFSIDKNFILREIGSFESLKVNFGISKDPDKKKAIINFMKSNKIKNFLPCLIFCESKIQAEEVGEIINNLGIKTTSFFVKQDLTTISNALIKGTIGQVLITVEGKPQLNYVDLGIFKSILYYNMPKSYVQLLNQCNYGDAQCFHHVFLNDTDYIKGRQQFLIDRISRLKVREVIKKALFLPEGSNGDNLCQSIDDFEENSSEGLKKNAERKISLPFASLITDSELKKDEIMKILLKLETASEGWIKIDELKPEAIKIRFLNPKPDSHIQKHQILQKIISVAQRASNIYRFKVKDLEPFGYSVSECVNLLKNLQTDDIIIYDVVEESLILSAYCQWFEEDINQISEYIHEEFACGDEIQLKYYDLFYTILKLNSVSNIECLLKNKNEIKDKSMEQKYPKTKLPNFYKACFTVDDFSLIDEIFLDESALSKLLPLNRQTNQRDKTALQNDMNEIIKNNSGLFKKYESSIEINLIEDEALIISKILYGGNVSTIDQSKLNYKDRYLGIDFKIVMQSLHDMLLNKKSVEQVLKDLNNSILIFYERYLSFDSVQFF